MIREENRSNDHYAESTLKRQRGTKLVSVVLSTYNEKENLSKMVPLIERVFETNGLNGEIVVVDDNSPDGTSSVAKLLGRDMVTSEFCRVP